VKRLANGSVVTTKQNEMRPQTSQSLWYYQENLPLGLILIVNVKVAGALAFLLESPLDDFSLASTQVMSDES